MHIIKKEPPDPDVRVKPVIPPNAKPIIIPPNAKIIYIVPLVQSTSKANSNKLDSTNITNEPGPQPLLNESSNVHGASNNNIVSSVMPTQIATIGSNSNAQSSLPACETWPGRYNFTVSFSQQNKSTKGISWTYSPTKDKLYVGKDAPCPVNFSVNAVMSSNAYIRVMALYTSPEQVCEIVHRCVNHSMEEIKNGRVEAQHLIRCESSTATYDTDASGRHSVLVPFENPPAGQKYSTYIYKFACFGSCSGGPNRRPLMLIFTLESRGQVIGRRKLDVKICACPGRDRKTEEKIVEAQCTPEETVNPILPPLSPSKRKLPTECVALSEVLAFTKSIYAPLPKKKKISHSKDGLLHITTEDRDCYDFLQQMKKFYEMCKAMKNVSPDILSMATEQLLKVKTEKE